MHPKTACYTMKSEKSSLEAFLLFQPELTGRLVSGTRSVQETKLSARCPPPNIRTWRRWGVSARPTSHSTVWSQHPLPFATSRTITFISPTTSSGLDLISVSVRNSSPSASVMVVDTHVHLHLLAGLALLLQVLMLLLQQLLIII